MRRLLPLPALLVATIAAVYACAAVAPSAAPASSKSALVGHAAPAFARDTVTGNRFDVVEARGKVVVVTFLGACADQERCAALARVGTASPDVVTVGISEDPSADDTRNLATRVAAPVIHDGDRILASRFHVRDLPMTYVLDAEGNVAWAGGPEKTAADIAAAVAATKS